MKRGEIYFLRKPLNKIFNRAVVVSNNYINEESDCVEVVYIEKYIDERVKPRNPLHVIFCEGISFKTLRCDCVQSFEKKYLAAQCGRLSADTLAAVDDALAISLGLPIEKPRKSFEKELEEYMKNAKVELITPEPDARHIKLETERDLYKQLYKDLLETITKGVKA